MNEKTLELSIRPCCDIQGCRNIARYELKTKTAFIWLCDEHYSDVEVFLDSLPYSKLESYLKRKVNSR